MSDRTCSLSHCSRKRHARGLCQWHYKRKTQGRLDWDAPILGAPTRRPALIPKTCEVDGCDARHCGRGLCAVHYQRTLRHGGTDALPQAMGERHPLWVGDAADYKSVHKRVARRRGVARNFACVECGKPATQWAYDHKDPDERRDDQLGLVFSLSPSHYQPMCRSCHVWFDRAHAEAKAIAVAGVRELTGIGAPETQADG